MHVDTSQPIHPDQFVRLLTQNERRVYAYILSLVPNWADADEILQETNVRLWQEYAKYEPGSNFAAWACTIAWYQILSFRKRRSRDILRFSDAFLKTVAAEVDRSAEEAEERHHALSSCIEQLTDTNQDLLRECYQSGSSIREVADRFGRSVESTYKALYRIRKFLHDCVQHRLSAQTD